MTNFEMAQKNYNRGLWTDDMLAKLVAKNKITEEQFAEITGKKYQ